MIDGLELVKSITSSQENNSLAPSTESTSELDRLLQAVLAIEDIVVDDNKTLDQANSNNDSVGTSPSVSDILSYKGNLNAVVPAGFILLHNDLVSVLKGSLEGLTQKVSDLNEEKKAFNLKDLFIGDDSILGNGLTLKSLFNNTGIETLGKGLGVAAGLAGFVDNLIESFNEDGTFDWGMFIGETVPALVAGVAAGIVTGNPYIGALVFGAVSALDLWGKANAETEKNFWTVQRALKNPGSEDYEKYHDLVELYIENAGEDASWIYGSVDDKYDYQGEGFWTTKGAWALADELVYMMDRYLAEGGDPTTGWFDAPEERTRKRSLEEDIMGLGEILGDTHLMWQTDSLREGSTRGIGEWFFEGYDPTNKYGAASIRQFLEDRFSEGVDENNFDIPKTILDKNDSELWLFLWNLKRYRMTDDKENFQYEWNPTADYASQSTYGIPQETPTILDNPLELPSHKNLYSDQLTENLETGSNPIVDAVTSGNEQMVTTLKNGIPVTLDEKSTEQLIQSVATVVLAVAAGSGGNSGGVFDYDKRLY